MTAGTARFTPAAETAWCPGCGNHDILQTLAAVLDDLALDPATLLLVGGIGQAAKLNQYLNANGFSGLHGRALPAATAAKMANEALTVIVNTGDGDSYGEGGNHWLHTIRRNVDITHFVHDNQIYGLTKGQTSPTSVACAALDAPVPFCSQSLPLNPLLVALAAGATFVARAFSGNKEHLAAVMRAAIRHEGYALVDILQPCVSFNKVNTFSWYNERVYPLDDGHDPANYEAALGQAAEFGDRIPIGILYEMRRPTYHETHGDLYRHGPLVGQAPPPDTLVELLESYQWGTSPQTNINRKERIDR